MRNLRTLLQPSLSYKTDVPGMLPPQGLCICYSHYWKQSFQTYLHGFFPYFFHVFNLNNTVTVNALSLNLKSLYLPCFIFFFFFFFFWWQNHSVTYILLILTFFHNWHTRSIKPRFKKYFVHGCVSMILTSTCPW